MSRSYKKTPGFKDSNRWFKRYANKIVRRAKDVPDGKAYRKFGDSYAICDYCSMFYNGKAEVIRYYERDVIEFAGYYQHTKQRIAPWRAWMK